MDPYRTKSIEMIKMTTREEREKLLEQARYNLFQMKSDHVYVDLLTDSGTSALSSKQWSAVMLGYESYAGAKSFYKFEEAVKNITRHKHILPIHQGRGAEKIVFSILGGSHLPDEIISVKHVSPLYDTNSPPGFKHWFQSRVC